MQGDIASFQNLNGLTTKNGICDEETLKTMLGNTYEGNGFIDVVGCAGGDTMTYRIYENGQVTER